MNTALTDAQKNSFWYPKFLVFTKDFAAKLPNSLLVATLVSNFGTFMLYMLTCVVAIVAFREHHMFNGFKHMVVPVFGLLANLACMLFYLIGPFSVTGMSNMEPFVALGIAAVWGLYGAVYFMMPARRRAKRPDRPNRPKRRCRRNVRTRARNDPRWIGDRELARNAASPKARRSGSFYGRTSENDAGAWRLNA